MTKTKVLALVSAAALSAVFGLAPANASGFTLPKHTTASWNGSATSSTYGYTWSDGGHVLKRGNKSSVATGVQGDLQLVVNPKGTQTKFAGETFSSGQNSAFIKTNGKETGAVSSSFADGSLNVSQPILVLHKHHRGP